MAQKLPNYLRTHRKRANLTQDQVTFLLGYRTGTRVSRYERFRREPPFRIALAFGVIYHTSIRKLFGGVFDEVRHRTEQRMRMLQQRIQRASQKNAATAGRGDIQGHRSAARHP